MRPSLRRHHSWPELGYGSLFVALLLYSHVCLFDVVIVHFVIPVSNTISALIMITIIKCIKKRTQNLRIYLIEHIHIELLLQHLSTSIIFLNNPEEGTEVKRNTPEGGRSERIH